MPRFRRYRLAIICCSWTIAVTLMAVGLAEDVSALRGFSILLGQVALVPTGWAVIECVVHQERVEAVAELADAIGYTAQDRAVTHLR